MTQTLLSRMGSLLRSFLLPGDPVDGAERDRLPAHDESYYWAMHAHW